MQTITASRARTLTIGALSNVTGVNIETIRYYERINLKAAAYRRRASKLSAGTRRTAAFHQARS